MKELKVTIAGVEYTAPAPRVVDFKRYLKLLRNVDGEDHIDGVFDFIASLFHDPAVTPDTLDTADFSEGARLMKEYADFINQFFPADTGKNGKAR
ncbi:MAG: hypothetical protein HFJ80_06450 [Clostridiales bacterium]|nr:hypothetical protein [Clostridiales bacterium]